MSILVAFSENVDIFLWHYTKSQQAVVFSRLAAIPKQNFITVFLYFVTWKSIDPFCTFNEFFFPYAIFFFLCNFKTSHIGHLKK